MSTENQLKSLLHALAVSYPLRLSEESLREDYGAIASALMDHGFLQQAEHATEAECPGGPSTCQKTVTPHNRRLFINCDCEEGVGLVEVKKAQINRFQVSLKPLLEWMAEEMNLSGGLPSVKEGEAWFIGKGRGGEPSSHFYSLRTNSPNEEVKFNDVVQKETPFIFWLGQTPQTGLLPKSIIPLEDGLEARWKSLFLNHRLISKLPTTPFDPLGDKTIHLDNNIALEKDGEVPSLLFERVGNVFQHRKRIRPQAYDLICFLNTMRNKKESSFKLQELAERLGMQNKRIVSDRIREINILCDEVDLHHLFHKFPGHRWGLNPQLKSDAV